MIAVYKITSPIGRVYIGQSININERFASYRRMDCKNQRRLYNSFIKYGVDSHVFEILQVCKRSELNIVELYFINKFNCLNKGGLNCFAIGGNPEVSDCTRAKMSKSALGRPSSKKGKKMSAESRLKMSLAKKGKPGSCKGRKMSDESKKLMSIAKKNKPQSNEQIEKRRQWIIDNKLNCKKVIDASTGVIYDSVKQAAEVFGFKYGWLSQRLRGRNINKTNLIFLKD